MTLTFNCCDNCTGSVCFCDDYNKQIERLHNETNNESEEKKKLQQTVLDFQSRYHGALERIEQLVAQNNRYREALEFIAEGRISAASIKHDYIDQVYQEIAHEALKREK